MDRLPSWRPPHGLRAKEISDIRWSMVNDAEGAVTDTIHLVNGASKGKRGGREIPMAKDLWQALVELQAFKPAAPEDRIIFSERDIGISPKVLAIWFLTLYRDLGFKGVSSHSGRRTFVTKAAKRCIEGGGSLRDVQQLAGHSSLATTQRYIEGSSDAPHRRPDLVMRRLSIQNDPAAVEASLATWDERRARRDKEQTCSVVDTLGGCQYDPLRTSGKRRPYQVSLH